MFTISPSLTSSIHQSPPPTFPGWRSLLIWRNIALYDKQCQMDYYASSYELRKLSKILEYSMQNILKKSPFATMWGNWHPTASRISLNTRRLWWLPQMASLIAEAIRPYPEDTRIARQDFRTTGKCDDIPKYRRRYISVASWLGNW